MHEGVIVDMERQQRRKAENIIVLQKQIDLTRQIKKQLQEENGLHSNDGTTIVWFFLIFLFTSFYRK